jgi:hypothetical protein
MPWSVPVVCIGLAVSGRMGLLPCTVTPTDIAISFAWCESNTFSILCQVRLAAWRYRRYAPRFIKYQPLCDCRITRVGVAVDIGKSLSVGV